MVVSKMKGVPILLHEPNAKAGRVTCIAAKARIPVCTGWEVCEPLPSGGFTPVGVPIRNLRRLPPEDAWKLLGYDLDLPPSPRVLVLGGSLGSDPMTVLFSKVSAEKPFCSRNFLVVGSSERAVRASGNLWLLPREWEIDLLYSIADGVVSRAGASTLAELVAFGLPSVIIPWRGAADDHQEHNARVFSEKGFGSIWEIDNGIHENLAFMIDYELKRARLGQAFAFSRNRNHGACEKIWDLVQQTVEGRGRN
jgi:UDP-N-acetylglucosamine--N-acetylmuramyl-(pentapeptide) pyrophosphoryl-undecaprenol N-acetylglucosamine transferase